MNDKLGMYKFATAVLRWINNMSKAQHSYSPSTILITIQTKNEKLERFDISYKRIELYPDS